MSREFKSLTGDHIVVDFARRPIQLWRITNLRHISPRNLVWYGLSSSIGLRHEQSKLEPRT
jgi:hypothetical protein